MKNNYFKWLFMICILSGCYQNDLDISVLDQDIVSDWTLPLLSTTLKINNIRELESFIGRSQDGRMEIQFRKDSLIQNTANQYLDIIPPQPIQRDSISLAHPIIEKTYEFGIIDDIQLNEVEFHQGILHFSFDEDVPIGTVVEVQILHAYKNGVPAIFTFSKSIQHNGGSVSIKDYTVDLGQFQSPNLMGYKVKLLAAPGNTPERQVLFQWRFDQVLVEHITGYFGSRMFELPSGIFDIEKSDLEPITNGLKFKDASLSFKLHNPLGVPFQFNGDVIINRKGVITRRRLPTINVPAAPSNLNSSISSFEFTASELSLSDILEDIPDKINLEGFLVSNPMDIQSINFATRDRELIIDFKLILPLDFRADGVVFNLPNRDISQIKDFPGNLLEADLQLTNVNSFPFDADFKLSFLDMNGITLDSFSLPLIQAASIGTNGKVISPVSYTNSIKLDDERLENLRNSTSLGTQITLQTPRDLETVVIYDDYYFKTKIAMNAKISYKKPK